MDREKLELLRQAGSPQDRTRQLIGSLPTHETTAAEYEGGQERYMQDVNVRTLLELLASQGTPTKGPEEFVGDPALMSRLASRYMGEYRGGPDASVRSHVPGEVDENWDLPGVINWLRENSPPAPTGAQPGPGPTSRPGFDYQKPGDVVRDLLRGKEPHLIRPYEDEEDERIHWGEQAHTRTQ
jgi:hypothetical protein